MQNFIGIVNLHLNWEEDNLNRNDCHDPPHAPRDFMMTGRHGEDWPRLKGQTPGKRYSQRWDSQMTHLGGKDGPWVTGADLSANNTGDGCLNPSPLDRDAFNSKGAWFSTLFGVA